MPTAFWINKYNIKNKGEKINLSENPTVIIFLSFMNKNECV